MNIITGPLYRTRISQYFIIIISHQQMLNIQTWWTIKAILISDVIPPLLANDTFTNIFKSKFEREGNTLLNKKKF